MAVTKYCSYRVLQLPNIALQNNFHEGPMQVMLGRHGMRTTGKHDRRFFARFGRRFHPAFPPFTPFLIIRAPKQPCATPIFAAIAATFALGVFNPAERRGFRGHSNLAHSKINAENNYMGLTKVVCS
jgi:hypothetical protein